MMYHSNNLPAKLNIEMASAACGIACVILQALLSKGQFTFRAKDVATRGAQMMSITIFTNAMFSRKVLGTFRSFLLLHIVTNKAPFPAIPKMVTKRCYLSK